MTRSGVLLAAMLALAIGCSGGTAVTLGPAPTPIDPSLARVTFLAGFRAGAAKALVDWSDTSIVDVCVAGAAGRVCECTLTAESPLCTIALAPGDYELTAERFDGALRSVETVGTAGRLVAGANTVVITFLNGEWTLDQPVVLSTGETVSAFGLAWDPDQLDAGLQPGVQHFSTRYALGWTVDGGSGTSRVRHHTGFVDGMLNWSALDGGGWSVTGACGEPEGAGYAGSCATAPGGDPDETWIRILGDARDGSSRCPGACGEGELAVSRLLPGQRFDPAIVPVANTAVLGGGVQISGTLLEYRYSSWTAEIVEVAGPFVPDPPSGEVTPGQPFDAAGEAYTAVVLCRDGLNLGTPEGLVSPGDWDFTGCADGVDANGWVYYGCGRLPPGGDPGECNWGLEWADADVGEWCDGTWDPDARSCDPGTADNVPQPSEFVDMNGDGHVSTGSVFVARFLTESFSLHGTPHAFTATGVPTMQVAAAQ